MALVVFLRGVNVGGHKTFRPTVLARELNDLDVVNVGAAGTFVIRKHIPRTLLREELARRLPFQTDIMICDGKDIAGFASMDPFAGQPSDRSIVRFVSVLAARQRPRVAIPLAMPDEDAWAVKVLRHEGRFVFGLYRREMKAIAWLGKLEKVLGVPATTRNWTTIEAIARILEA